MRKGELLGLLKSELASPMTRSLFGTRTTMRARRAAMPKSSPWLTHCDPFSWRHARHLRVISCSLHQMDQCGAKGRSLSLFCAGRSDALA